MPLMDLHKFTSPSWGTQTSIRVGDVTGPAAGMSTSASTNDTALSVYGMNQFASDGMEYGTDKPWRRSGIHGYIHGNLTNGNGNNDSNGDDTSYDEYSNESPWQLGYDGNDGGNISPMFANNEGTFLGSPVAAWFGIIAALILIKLIAEQVHSEGEFSNVKVGLLNILLITLMAKVGDVWLKWFFGYVKVPGLSQIIEQ